MNENIEESNEPMGKGELLKYAFVAVFAFLASNLFLLFLLAKGAKCEPMASCVLVASVTGACSLIVPLAYLVIAVIMMAMRHVSAFAIVPFVIYCAVFIPSVTYIPQWQKVVPNVRTAYAEYKAKYPGNGHRKVFADAERWGNLTRPVFDWLAR